MGVENHNAVIATSSFKPPVEIMCDWIRNLDPEISKQFLISPPGTNGYVTIMLSPDGSKEGWTESDHGDVLRQNFIDRLNADDYEDGSSPWYWVEIGFGEYGQKVLRGNNKNRYSDTEYLKVKDEIDIEELQVGDKVHYQPEHYGPDKWENGLIKVIDTDLRKDAVWVVYNCAGIWIGYQKYTAALTNLRDLRLGWKHQPGDEE